MQKQKGGWGLAGIGEALRRVLPYMVVAEPEVSSNMGFGITHMKMRRSCLYDCTW